MDSPIEISDLKPLRELPISDEAKAFSGTMTYQTAFSVGKISKRERYQLDLGRVEQIAQVTLNGKRLQSVWTYPYKVDVTDYIKKGKNDLLIEVTNTWFNRLSYDSKQPEADRKTWTTNYPPSGSQLRDSGLIGPVVLVKTVRHVSD